MRGEVHRLRAPRDARGHEQRGSRYAVVVQSDLFPLSTWLVAPTSIVGGTTRVLVEQTAAVDPSRLGDSVGTLTFDELRHVDAALRLLLALQVAACAVRQMSMADRATRTGVRQVRAGARHSVAVAERDSSGSG